MALPDMPANAFDKRGPVATPFVFLVSIDLSLSFSENRPGSFSGTGPLPRGGG
jgi:hypothetical protein